MDQVSLPADSVPVSTVAAVTVVLPQFWTANAQAWFDQAEEQFALRGVVAEDMRYWYVLASFDKATAIRICPLLSDLDTSNRYSALKHLLLSTYSLSDDQRARQFLSITELGDKLPSEVMDYMLWLHASEPTNFLLKFCFTRLLPATVRHALGAFQTKDLRKLAREADRLMADFDDRAPQVALLRDSSLKRPLLPPENPTPDVSAVTCSRRRPFNSFQHYDCHEDEHNDLCFYHRKFGDAAHQCRPPCQWSGNAQAGSHR